MDLVKFTPEKWTLFKEAYKIAVEEKDESFVFDNRHYVTGYAKYMIEYYDDKISLPKK